MKVSVIGLGYLGVTHSVALAKLGHDVVGIEPNPEKLGLLLAGKVPFHEPGLEREMQRQQSLGKLTFQEFHSENSRACQVHFICVGTPQKESGEADTSYVFAAAEELAQYLLPTSVVAGKSTVPVGTAAAIKQVMDQVTGFSVHLAWNPEFLKEGTALSDSLNPDRIVIGSWDEYALQQITDVYKPIIERGTPLIALDVATAELVKVAANAFLATKISFINAMAEIAEATGADAVALAEALGHDERIGKKFLRTGIGFGGGCLPKDIRGFIASAEQLGVGSSLKFLRNIDEINLRRRERVVKLAVEELNEIAGKKIVILGISFKPDSDDLRDSPALEIARRLSELGYQVVVHDPIALPALSNTEPFLAESDLNKATKDADLIILGTEWKEYLELDPSGVLARNRTVIDGRNVLNVAKWKAANWKVIALGRNIKN